MRKARMKNKSYKKFALMRMCMVWIPFSIFKCYGEMEF